MSTTSADCFEMPESSEAKKAAPRMEFVGPEELGRTSLTRVAKSHWMETRTMFE